MKDISGRIDPFPKEELLGLLNLIDRSLKEEDRLNSSWGGMKNAGEVVIFNSSRQS